MTARWLAAVVLPLLAVRAMAAPDYAVVVSSATKSDAGWSKVVDALREKHKAAVVVYTNDVKESLPALRSQFPRYTCFVATPAEASRELVKEAHRLTRQLDDDPYADTFWAILTGYDADNALRIAKHSELLVVKRVLSGTPIALDRCEEGRWFSELEAGRVETKEAGKTPVSGKGEADSTAALVAGLNDYAADLFVTSGHATEHDWQIGYRYRGGQFRCKDGQLFGLDTKGAKHSITSQHARVYLPVGNCLMGHIDGADCMALAYMNSAGVTQMIGYTEPTWYGYMGWGMLDYFLEQPGRFTLVESFFANEHALINRLNNEVAKGSQDAKGLTFDSEVVALYGDPAWQARMADGPRNWDQKLTRDANKFVFEITPRLGDKTFGPVDTNGSQRGGRPIIQFLPHRVKDVKIIEGADLRPVIADDFILVPNPGKCDQAGYKLVFQSVEI